MTKKTLTKSDDDNPIFDSKTNRDAADLIQVSSRYTKRALRALSNMQLFEPLKDSDGKVIRGKSKVHSRSSAFDQVLLKMRDNYEQEARVAEIQGVNYQAQAGLFGLQASAQNPGFAAAGSLLSSAGKVSTAFGNIPSGPRPTSDLSTFMSY